jgi:hypothetical protein
MLLTSLLSISSVYSTSLVWYSRTWWETYFPVRFPRIPTILVRYSRTWWGAYFPLTSSHVGCVLHYPCAILSYVVGNMLPSSVFLCKYHCPVKYPEERPAICSAVVKVERPHIYMFTFNVCRSVSTYITWIQLVLFRPDFLQSTICVTWDKEKKLSRH